MKMINRLLICVGVLFMLLGIINYFVPGAFLGITTSVVKYFHIATSFFVLAIASKIVCTKD